MFTIKKEDGREAPKKPSIAILILTYHVSSYHTVIIPENNGIGRRHQSNTYLNVFYVVIK